MDKHKQKINGPSFHPTRQALPKLSLFQDKEGGRQDSVECQISSDLGSAIKKSQLCYSFNDDLKLPIVPPKTILPMTTPTVSPDKNETLNDNHSTANNTVVDSGEFENLKIVLESYLFGTLKSRENYLLSPKEVLILKYLLKKKFFYSQGCDFAKNIDALEGEHIIDFLHTHPQKKRTQVLKRMIFTNVWKHMLRSGVDI